MTAIHTPDYSPATPGRPMAASAHWLAVPGRVLISAIFLMSGVGKLTHLSGMASMVHLSPAVLAVAGVVEILGGASLLLGAWTRLGALLLFLFLIPTTLMFHNFWAAAPAQQQEQLVNFLKNLAIMGGLLSLAAYGAGPLSVHAAARTRVRDGGRA